VIDHAVQILNHELSVIHSVHQKQLLATRCPIEAQILQHQPFLASFLLLLNVGKRLGLLRFLIIIDIRVVLNLQLAQTNTPAVLSELRECLILEADVNVLDRHLQVLHHLQRHVCEKTFTAFLVYFFLLQNLLNIAIGELLNQLEFFGEILLKIPFGGLGG
jgi:hypothetical protein